jgi:energy-coupling factor transporter ATP-binding protein EcfA2
MLFQGIERVNFGHIAAEEEVANLQRYFIETEEYEKVKSDTHKILVIGRKGSGKSAIYVALRDYLPQKDKTVVVEALSLQDYPWQIHKRIRDIGVPNEQAYVNSWKYVIWVLLAKRILEYSRIQNLKILDTVFWQRWFNKNARYIYRFLKQNYGSISPSFAEIIADRSRDIRSISIFGFEINTQSDESSHQKLSRSINVVNRELQARVLNLLAKQKQYFILHTFRSNGLGLG